MNNTLINTYFDAFVKKDIRVIDNILTEDVILMDWNVSAYSKPNVLEVFQSIFESFESIKVDIVDVIIQDNKVSAQIYITLDEVFVKVVDILHFKGDKICKIDAFKQ